MTWQSASWEISLQQTTSVKRRNTGERRQVTIMFGLDLWSHDLARVETDSSLIYFQEAMRRLAGLLPDGLKQDIYGLWEVPSILLFCYTIFADYLRIMELIWKYLYMPLYCRNTRTRAAQRPAWSKSLTFWRWSSRLTSTRNWRGRQEDCRSSLTPPTVCLILLFLQYKGKYIKLLMVLIGLSLNHNCLFSVPFISFTFLFRPRSFSPPRRLAAPRLPQRAERKSHDNYRDLSQHGDRRCIILITDSCTMMQFPVTGYQLRCREVKPRRRVRLRHWVLASC